MANRWNRVEKITAHPTESIEVFRSRRPQKSRQALMFSFRPSGRGKHQVLQYNRV
jgi:hypothetical protein